MSDQPNLRKAQLLVRAVYDLKGSADRCQLTRQLSTLDVNALAQSPALHVKINLSCVHGVLRP
jgi:hypothetical protein